MSLPCLLLRQTMKLYTFPDYKLYVINALVSINSPKYPTIEQIDLVASILWDTVAYRDLKRYKIVAFSDDMDNTVIRVYLTTNIMQSGKLRKDMFFHVTSDLHIRFNTPYRLEYNIKGKEPLCITYRTILPT